jgi:hypothetical protein
LVEGVQILGTVSIAQLRGDGGVDQGDSGLSSEKRVDWGYIESPWLTMIGLRIFPLHNSPKKDMHSIGTTLQILNLISSWAKDMCFLMLCGSSKPLL